MESEQMIISLVARIRRKANSLIIKELKKHDIKDIETSHGDIIGNIFMKNALTMGELAQNIERDKSTVTALVDKLVSLGYVEKIRSGADSRVTFVRLTKKSKSLWPVFEDISKNLLSTVYKGFSEQEKEALIKLLTRINNNL